MSESVPISADWVLSTSAADGMLSSEQAIAEQLSPSTKQKSCGFNLRFMGVFTFDDAGGSVQDSAH